METHDYPDRYPAKLRMLRVIQDFFTLKAGNWSVTEIKYLQKALKEVELPWREEITLGDFIDGLIDEIDEQGFDVYEQLVDLTGTQWKIENSFVLDNISAPSHKALYKIADSYNHSSDVIDLLVDELSISRRDALKRVLRSFIEKEGIDTSIAIPLRDLAVELLGCHGLMLRLLMLRLNNRYQNLDNGTVLDTQTFLQWMRCALGQKLDGQTCIGQAKKYNCNDVIEMRNTGYEDWRLPTIEELKKLVIEGQNPTIDQQVFPNTPNWCFWSISKNHAGRSLVLSFNDGCDYYSGKDEDAFYVRLVRGGQ